MLHAIVAAALDNVQEPGHVALDVDVRILDGIAHSGLRSQVDDPLEALCGEQFLHCRAVGQLHFDEAKILERPQHVQPGLLEARIIVVVQVIETHHLIAAFQ